MGGHELDPDLYDAIAARFAEAARVAACNCRIVPCISAGHAGKPGISAEFYARNAAGEVSGVLGDHGRCEVCNQAVTFPPADGVTLVLYQRGTATPPLIVAHWLNCPNRYTPEQRTAARELADRPKLQPWQTATVTGPPPARPSDLFAEQLRQPGLLNLGNPQARPDFYYGGRLHSSEWQL